MSIQPEDVLKIAHLARLGIQQTQVESYALDLSNIMNLAEQMNLVDTSDIEPMAHPLDHSQRLRADVVSETNQRDELQQNAPDTKNGFFLVPRVID